ncbi:THUMP domain-containing class I SAM-dependent RNA methyltransferase [Fructilactobacillus cliffordii]|uniref:Class I SAM-dependent RNA methyltransferase n=1 Tax=Fructilactobacillus cliffordii TaxID=2940299 RepID=A0A9Q9E2D4_9LACO|nr:class I SAM-dependent RNA methyltransferase [Fructilactobacillus cliffordii]USS89660.1 class I SAM-dependent RNA methyltransferase [Fructilactobacillus cliffordii]
MQKFNLMATCAAGIEAVTANELKQMGYQVNVLNGMVLFSGTVADIIKTNLWLRTADRIKIIVGEFEAQTFDELFEGTKALPWESLIPMDGEFPVAGRSKKSSLHSVPDVQAITKKAIATKLASFYHRRTRLPETEGLYPLEVRINKNHVLELLDTTGPSLFKRGYRIAKGEAPLKENMAAALILFTNWHPETMPFLDPMCGSGTIPIEAAMIARNVAPGIKRSFAFEEWDWISSDLVQEIRDEAVSVIKDEGELHIQASDVNGEMINHAKVNAQAMGLLHDIQFKQLAVQDFKTTSTDGVVVTNPPYGQRLGDQEAATKLYHDLGQVFRPLTTWSKYYLTSDLNFEKAYGQKATKRRKLYNGQIRTDYFQYWGTKA